MLGSIGMGELLIIFVIALIVFGPRKLPELGRSLGKTLGEFKRASNDLRNTLEEEIHVEDQTQSVRFRGLQRTWPRSHRELWRSLERRFGAATLRLLDRSPDTPSTIPFSIGEILLPLVGVSNGRLLIG